MPVERSAATPQRPCAAAVCCPPNWRYEAPGRKPLACFSDADASVLKSGWFTEQPKEYARGEPLGERDGERPHDVLGDHQVADFRYPGTLLRRGDFTASLSTAPVAAPQWPPHDWDGLAGGIPVDLLDAATDLDDRNIQRLVTAIRHASGNATNSVDTDDRL